MTNELLLIATLIGYFGLEVLWYKLFGRVGLYAFTIFATITANIEVLLLINAFGLDQTLGNVLFATTFSCTKIISEMEGEKGKLYAKKAAAMSIATTGLFMILTKTWVFYIPASGNIVSEHMRIVFANSPRIMLSSLVVLGICQLVQIGTYALVWKIQKHKEGGLWLRGGITTLFTQIVNVVLFTFFAFWGIYEMGILLDIIIASYAIYIVTSFWDTGVLYIAKNTCKNRNILFKGSDD